VSIAKRIVKNRALRCGTSIVPPKVVDHALMACTLSNKTEPSIKVFDAAAVQGGS
jgi:hypothetical protein